MADRKTLCVQCGSLVDDVAGPAETEAKACPVCAAALAARAGEEAGVAPLGHTAAGEAVRAGEVTQPGEGGPNCPYCLTSVRAAEPAKSCPTCQAVYHEECWTENGGCAVYGCAQAPVAESRAAIEVPVSYWGRENKPCPACRQEILAAAMRCRHCGTTFASARPQEAGEFQQGAALREQLPEAKRRVVTIFVLCLIPFLAPVGAAWGLWWRRGHREELAALPAIFGALHRIGVIAAIAFSVVLVVLTGAYVTLND